MNFHESARDWALNNAGDSEAALFTGTFPTEDGVNSEPVIACRFPASLLERLSETTQISKSEAYISPGLSMNELADGRNLLIVWLGLRIFSDAGEARWIIKINPCDTSENGFTALTALEKMEKIKVFSYAGETPFEFEAVFGTRFKTQIARIVGSSTGCDRFTQQEFDEAVAKQLTDPDTKDVLIDHLFPDNYNT